MRHVIFHLITNEYVIFHLITNEYRHHHFSHHQHHHYHRRYYYHHIHCYQHHHQHHHHHLSSSTMSFTETAINSRFIQSHAWMLKNSVFSMAFIDYFLSFSNQMMCSDIAYEQGALQFTIGHFMKMLYSANTTRFDCINYCHSKMRSSYAHHHCVLDWFSHNHLGMNKINGICP